MLTIGSVLQFRLVMEPKITAPSPNPGDANVSVGQGLMPKVLPIDVNSSPSPKSAALPTVQANAHNSQTTSSATADATSNAPIIAGDEDVIEKEWVDKAKVIVANTKNDPYAQGREISKLQADYLKKRYGKEIKVPSE